MLFFQPTARANVQLEEPTAPSSPPLDLSTEPKIKGNLLKILLETNFHLMILLQFLKVIHLKSSFKKLVL